MFLSIQSKCKDVYVLSGLCQDDIKNWWFCRWGQLEICTWNCTLWPEFLCQMVKGTCLFLSGYQFCQAFSPSFLLPLAYLSKIFPLAQKLYAANDDKNHDPDKAAVHPTKCCKHSLILLYFSFQVNLSSKNLVRSC